MKKSDAALILTLAAAALVLFFVNRSDGSADTAEVYCRGEMVWSCPLRAEGEYEIGGVAVEVKGGRARIAYSDCPDKSCVNCGWLTHAGQSAVCIPNAVSLTLTGGGAPDAVIY